MLELYTHKLFAGVEIPVLCAVVILGAIIPLAVEKMSKTGVGLGDLVPVPTWARVEKQINTTNMVEVVKAFNFVFFMIVVLMILKFQS
ncbi:hypothetical protein ATE92_0733 [Ulvibacter sp. MAR_2010_11]|nr:hypothetical protein ATE92_0733 [Ulvibacter sp. MAR_2010_11]